MNNKSRLLLLAALFVLVLPLMFAGTASARYMADGATPNGTGGWQIPTDFVCIVGLHTDGTLDIADGVTDRHTCQYLTKGTMNGGTAFDLSSMTSSTACATANAAGNDGAKHAWATSICMKNGAGLSLAGLDRTQKMCEGIGGTWVTSGVCTAYNAQFKGQDATGAPLAFGTKGTTQAAGTGYCYTTMNMTTAYSTQAACPSNQATVSPFNANAAYDWAWGSSKCTYAKGIAGYLNANLTHADGTTTGTTAGTFVDLSVAAPTMGQCLALGASWANWTKQAASTTAVATTPLGSTIPAWDYTKDTPDADNGCLHCHSTTTQYNGPAERWKDSYVKTGHKNMLRKVTAGQPWAGPDGVVYTTDGTNTINFMTSSDPYAKVTVAGVDQNLYYIYGDWMAALPTLIYGKTGYGTPPNNTTGDNNGYSCYACHTTGASDSSGSVPGVQSIGTPGYAGIEPGNSFPGLLVNANNPKWDLDGIQCGRCHNAEVGPIGTYMINASAFTTTSPTSGGMGALANGTGRANLCFGCHQSIAKAWPTQGGAAGGTTQYDPTLIPTGVSHGAAQGRDFNGHVLGNSFLNSVHGQYAGVNSNSTNGGIKLNALGKYDLVDPNGTAEYRGIFQGYTCWQSSSSSSPAKTKADGTEIKDKTTCESLYGAGAWRTDSQGTCTTCHDVHNSLFVASQEEAAMRKTCEDCHVNNATIGATNTNAPQVTISNIQHPNGGGTPFDTALYGEDPCIVCHMATQAVKNGDQNSMAVHLWRINTSASYNTFPTLDQWNGTNGATKDRNAQTSPDGVQTNAVWVDLDMACGQCHGGSLG